DMMGAYFAATLGWPALLAGVAGMALLLCRRAWALFAVIALPVLLFAGYFAARTVLFERNLSHVVPLFLVCAGVAVAAAHRWLGRRGGLATLTVAALCMVLLWRPAIVT